MDAAGWNERYQANEHPWGFEPNRFVREQCESLPVGEAVDLACGEGRNALWLAGIGWRVTGVDFSDVAIERARALTAQQPEAVRRRLSWRIDDVTTLELAPDSVDLLLIGYLHLPPADRDGLVRRSASALRAGGHLLVIGHDKRNLTEGVSGPQDITLLYEPGAMRALAEGCGLTVETAATVERPTDDGVALDTLLRAHRA